MTKTDAEYAQTFTAENGEIVTPGLWWVRFKAYSSSKAYIAKVSAMRTRNGKKYLKVGSITARDFVFIRRAEEKSND